MKAEQEDDIRPTLAALRDALGERILGNAECLDLLLVAMVAGGHVLIEGGPGTGKTTLVRLAAEYFGGDFKRIQFTPDLLPSDIVGCRIYDQGAGSFRFEAGPVFANMLLADEINRASPRTQSALLEAMAEHQVTCDGTTRLIPEPFLVAATRNAMRSAGTFELPDALLDRFMLSFVMDVPDAETQMRIIASHQGDGWQDVVPVIEPEHLVSARKEARRVFLSPAIERYIVSLADAVRSHPGQRSGVSVRAVIALADATRARAYLEGRKAVYPEDVKALAVPVLRHRLDVRLAGAGLAHAGNLVADAIRTVSVPPRGEGAI